MFSSFPQYLVSRQLNAAFPEKLKRNSCLLHLSPTSSMFMLSVICTMSPGEQKVRFQNRWSIVSC